MAEQKTNHYFTDDDIKEILKVQGEIQKDIAVAANNLTWMITTYTNQCTEISGLKDDLQKLKDKVDSITITVWKYVGMGAGAVLAIELLVMALPYIAKAFSGGVA